jgi:NAD(P)-dependent dehydrogenase (short-subunit alcohol dehydrogenase family)
MRRIVVVTGCFGGIGQALVARFQQRGWTVIGTDFKDATSLIRPDIFLKCDLADPEQVKELGATIAFRYSIVTCLINNAAKQIIRSALETTVSEWNHVMQVNVAAPLQLIKSISSLIPPGGTIINISSVHARATSPNIAAYSVSKAALSGLTRVLALELGNQGIRVNSILPGAIDTPMLWAGTSRSEDASRARDGLLRASPLGQIGKPEDIASLAGFLAEEGFAGNITGQEFVCDSGILARLSSE